MADRDDGVGDGVGPEKDDPRVRTRERAVMLVLASVQFMSIVDFILVMPLGPQLKRSLGIDTDQFGLIVASYTISAGVSGLLAATVIERFGRKTAFLTLFAGFLIGTLFCGLANTYHLLLAARVLTGAFGGVLGGMALAVIVDVFPAKRHGQATGALMSAFSMASVLGVPFGVAVGNRFGWQKPFLLLAALGAIVLAFAYKTLPPLRGHLDHDRPPVDPLKEIWATIVDPNHLKAFALIVALMLGGFAVIPFIPTYLVANVGVAEANLPLIYIVGGALTIVSSPRIGKLADRYGRFRTFCFVAPFSALMMIAVATLPRVPLAIAIASVALLIVGNTGRMVAAMAMIMSRVDPRRRGSFMSVYSSVQHIASGLGTLIGGLIILEGPGGSLVRYWLVGLFAATVTLLSIPLAARLRPAGLARPISPAFSLGAADQAVGDPGDPLPAVETS